MKENYFLYWHKEKGDDYFKIKKKFFKNEKEIELVSKIKNISIYNKSIREGGREKKKIKKLTDFLKSLEKSVDFNNLH